MKPYFETESGKLYQGDCLDIMKTLPNESINCGITSPPYWGLRDYGVKDQLGLEETLEEYVEKMVRIFHEFKRVLKYNGTLWLNLGDKHNSGSPGARDPERWPKQSSNNHPPKKSVLRNLKTKDLVGIPWRVAFALQADGWYLRQDIIWHKPNPMPESVTDRCTKAHDYIFLLSKSPKYYFDNEAIKEPCSANTNPKISKEKIYKIKQARLRGNNTSAGSKYSSPKTHTTNGLVKQNSSFENAVCLPVKTKNKRSVWTVATKAFKGAHFATFPPDLILPCVLAGCPEGGVIMDMFFGAGTTGLVAMEKNRKFLGVELSEKNCKIAIDRFDPIANQTRF